MPSLSDVAPRFTNHADAIHWLRDRRITEVECIIPDMNGIMRGKIVPREDFIRIIDAGVRLPEFVFFQAVTGDSAVESKRSSTLSTATSAACPISPRCASCPGMTNRRRR